MTRCDTVTTVNTDVCRRSPPSTPSSRSHQTVNNEPAHHLGTDEHIAPNAEGLYTQQCPAAEVMTTMGVGRHSFEVRDSESEQKPGNRNTRQMLRVIPKEKGVAARAERPEGSPGPRERTPTPPPPQTDCDVVRDMT